MLFIHNWKLSLLTHIHTPESHFFAPWKMPFTNCAAEQLRDAPSKTTEENTAASVHGDEAWNSERSCLLPTKEAEESGRII